MSSSQKSFVSTGALVLGAGFLVLFINGGARFTIGLTLKPIVDEFGWGRSELGVAVAVFQIVSAVAMFAAGRLADSAGPRAVLCGGLIVSGIGIGLMGMIAAPWHAVLLYGVVYGIGSGAASLIPVGVMVTHAFPKRAGMANAVVISGMSVGQLVVVATLAAVLLAVSWHAIYLWLGFAHLALAPLLLLAIPRTEPAQTKTESPLVGVGVLVAARSRQFWLLNGVYAICGFTDFFVATHVVAFAQDHGVDAYLAGNLLALMGLTGLVGIFAAGAFSDRAGPVWPAALSFAARLAVFALIVLDQSVVSVVVFALVFGGTFLMTAPLTVVFASENFGTRHLGAMIGLITMVHHICGGLGAYYGAALFDATGDYSFAFMTMFVLSAAAMLLTLLLRQPAGLAAA